MEEGKPFFYRINAARFLKEMLNYNSDKERGKFIKQFAIDLVTCSSANDYTNGIIAEAIEYMSKKQRAGRDGGNKKASNAKAALKQCKDFASSKSLASSSSSSSTETEALKSKEEIGDKSPPPSALFDLWNRIVKEPRALTMNKSREAKCRLRLRERPLDQWEAIFREIKSTPFLQGDNPRGWRADFDWIIANDTNNVKVMEGRYEVSNNAQAKQPSLGLVR